MKKEIMNHEKERNTFWNQIWNNRYITVFLWVLLIIWRIPFINKGIDYLDTGFSMENYRNVFSGEGIQSLGVFFTTLIGGGIYEILPAYQLLVLRVLHWGFGLATTGIAYLIFRRYLNTNLLLVILLIINISSKGGEMLFNYYSMTSLFLMMAIYFLLKGIREEKNVYILIAGVVSGINMFMRLTNLLYFSMSLMIIWYGIYTKKDTKKIIRSFGSYVLGCIAAVLAVLPVLIATLGLQTLVESFMGYVNLALGRTSNDVVNVLGVQEKSGHSLIAEIKTIGLQGIRSIWAIIKCFIPFILIEELVQIFVRKCVEKKNSYISRGTFLVIAIISACLFSKHIYPVKTYLLGLYAIVISICVGIRFRKSVCEKSTVLILGVLISACSVFGSDRGLGRLSIVMLYLAPALVMAIQMLLIENKDLLVLKRLKISAKFCEKAEVYLFIGILISGILIGLPKVYNDADYSDLLYEVNEEIYTLRGMKTSQVRAEEINELYEVMNTEEIKNEEVAVFGYFPLAFSIIENTDYFESVQPGIDWPAVSVESLLKVINKKQEKGVVPVIVVSYVNAIQNNEEHFTTEAKEAVLEYMLSLNTYKKYIDNEYYTIYVPAED